MNIRASGVLLHITSLPSRFGVGDMGPQARHFADLLADAGQLYWQILPLGPTSPALGNSPYAGFTAFAGNPLLISLEDLVTDGLLSISDIGADPPARPDRVDYEAELARKSRLLGKAYANAASSLETHDAFQAFCREHAEWLDDWTLFVSLKEHYNGLPWHVWAVPHRDRHDDAIATWREEAAERIQGEAFAQFLFFQQWNRLRDYCRARCLRFIGDLPIYVSQDSADVWTHPHLFKLGANKRPTVVAGVPPDYFSATGQRWGNPVYDWPANKAEGYGWWTRRVAHNLTLYDAVRIDHFRGFAAYWEISAHEETAIHGTWVDGPGAELFELLSRRISSLPIIAEDLGVITADVRELKNSFNLPGMKILQFAFGDEKPKHIPYLHDTNCIVYTGTHDNNTARGWFESEASLDERESFATYLGHWPESEDIHRIFMRMAMQSVANTVIIPMQDILGLDSACRMNKPSTLSKNWEWRLTRDAAVPETLKELAEMTRFFDRAPLLVGHDTGELPKG
ncbi:4-alpha-glucanotransferase [Desulfovibrio inopinatus]|uniref:4-alpha-glucanotransferase n=1 Tax=Desulfovibrio inopinatus TaxID=102109 RepID=UPI00042191CD|nr:4-alpha-glucanotransferase [Desulfovibrio inopinatus]